MKRLLLPTLAILAVVSGCAPKAKPVTLEEGQPVKLILLKQLEAGQDQKDSEVPFLVAEDVKGEDGSVLIKKGALAKGKVTWSRSEGTLSALANQPARLAVAFEETKAVDGATVPLGVDRDGKEEAYQFTRGNTGAVDLGSKLDDVWESESAQKLLTRIHDSFQGKDDLNFNDSETKEALKDLSKQLSLENLSSAVDQDKLSDVDELMRQIRQGGTVAGIASGGSTVALSAVMELANLAGNVGSRLGRMLKGRTIRAYPGEEVTAYVKSAVQVTLVGKS